MSSKNPFRKPPPSEEEERAAAPSPPSPSLSHRTSSPPLPPLPERTPSPISPPPPPRSSDSGPSLQSPVPTPASHERPPDTSSMARIVEDIDDDLPPPYTPAATQGEETVGLGPLRPFQQALLIPPSSLHSPSGSHPYSNRPSPAARPLQPYHTGPGSSFGPHLQLGMTPWQNQQQYHQRRSPGLLGTLFDTVRDIADVVSGAYDERVAASQRANAGAYAVPYSNTGTVYAPPPPPPRPASTPSHSSSPSVSDDGSPTRTPVPGHPLLRSGELIVYPKDHWCDKCKNTGYKNYDPSHPCRKCWEKYGKPYTGALTYLPWSSSRQDPRMQRPLPKFLPPHLAPPSQSMPVGASYHPPPQHPQYSRSASQPRSVDPSGPGPSYYVMNPLSPDSTPPVPHAIAVRPGDSRLGGRLCTRCDGDGIRTIMLIDVTTCEECGGTGRIWR